MAERKNIELEQGWEGMKVSPKPTHRCEEWDRTGREILTLARGNYERFELTEGASSVGINKLKNILEGKPETPFISDEYINLYTYVLVPTKGDRTLYSRTIHTTESKCLHYPSTIKLKWCWGYTWRRTIYNMCTQKPPHDYSAQLYERYREAFNEYIYATVLPALREKHDEYMLRELVKRWENHKLMVRWLSRFFNYLDRYYISRHSLAPLTEVGLRCFHGACTTKMGCRHISYRHTARSFSLKPYEAGLCVTLPCTYRYQRARTVFHPPSFHGTSTCCPARVCDTLSVSVEAYARAIVLRKGVSPYNDETLRSEPIVMYS
eukprot:4212947-Pyramimonas_sp.AAC.3